MSAVDPVSSMEAIHHVVVGQVAEDISSHLRQVIDELGRESRLLKRLRVRLVTCG